MAFVLKDRVRQYSRTEGTGDLSFSGTLSGYQTFDSVLGAGDTTLVYVGDSAGNWLTFLGTWNDTTKTMARTTIYESSAGGANVSLTGEGQVAWINMPAQRYLKPYHETLAIGNLYSEPTGARKFTMTNSMSVAGGVPVWRTGGNYYGASGGSLFVHQMGCDSDQITGGAVIFDVFSSLKSTWGGGRTLAWDRLTVDAAGTAGSGTFLVSGASWATAYASAGGILGGPVGNLFGRNDSSRIMDGTGVSPGRYYNSVVGAEFNAGVYRNNQARWVVGVQSVLWGNAEERGVDEDTAYKIGMQSWDPDHPGSGVAAGWRTGILIGGRGGWWPFTSTSTLMTNTEGPIAGGPTEELGLGFDFRWFDFAVAPWAAQGSFIDPDGNIGGVSVGGDEVKTRSAVKAYTGVVATVDILDGGYFDPNAGALTLTFDAPPTPGTTATATVATYEIPYVRNFTSAGTGYAVGDTVQLNGGTASTAAVITIDKVSGGGVQGAWVSTKGTYTSISGVGGTTTALTGAGTGLVCTVYTAPKTITVSGGGSGYAPNLPPNLTASGGLRRRPVFRVNMTESQALLDLNPGARVRLDTHTPASAAATGTAGTVAWDADYVYVCTAANTWKRAAIATW